MKKVIALVLTLVLVSAVALASATTIPAKTSAIEGLPEMPAVQRFTTKATDTAVTVTLAEPLKWLNAVSQWYGNFVAIDFAGGLVGTYSLETFKSQPGTGTWGSFSSQSLHKDIISAENAQWYADEYGIAGLPATFSYYSAGYTWGPSNWSNGGGKGREMFEDIFVKNADGTYTNYWGFYSGTFGWSEMGYAYDGETVDGAKVKFDRWGRVVSITVEVPGANFFEDETAPEKTEVTWSCLVTDYGRRMYISDIKATYADGSTITAQYSGSAGGKLIRVK